jgi:uncharacterized protein (TIGR02145 family)
MLLAAGAAVLAALGAAGGAYAQSGTLTDPRDGRVYRTVKIGALTWMAENLNLATDSVSFQCYGLTNSNVTKSNCEIYGRLYTWDAAMSACPAGWRLPDREEWNDLVQKAGGENLAGRTLKSKSGWSANNGTDEFGFSALPGGYCWPNREWERRRSLGLGHIGSWWSATDDGGGNAWNRVMSSGNERGTPAFKSENKAREDLDYKTLGLSVRCVREE